MIIKHIQYITCKSLIAHCNYLYLLLLLKDFSMNLECEENLGCDEAAACQKIESGFEHTLVLSYR